MDAPFDIPADLDTPVSAWLKLRPLRPRFVLESVEGGERLGRYSFLGFGDAMAVRLAAGALTVDGVEVARPADGTALLEALRNVLRRAPRLGPDLSGVPFRGGLVGFCGYDMAGRFERLPFPGNRPADDGPEAAWVAPRSVLVFDHLSHRVALLHDGPETERAGLRREVVRALRGPVPPSVRCRPHEPPRASLRRAEFLDAVAAAQRDILDGEVFQLVLSIAFAGACGTPPFEAYRALRLLNPSPYLYFLDLGDVAVAGSSPEALVRLEGGRALLRPIAGTRPRASDPTVDLRLERELLADAKEAAEHVMLVDLARNDLGRVAVPGSIEVAPYRSIERYSHVMHLVSGVRGELAPGRDAFDLFAAAFPAGTVVGAPKIRAMHRIHELEPVRRDVYAGTVGYFGHDGAMDQAIAIRTLTFRNGRYAYQAGAGIVADSVPEREYEEVLAKAAAARRALALAAEAAA